MEEQNRQPNEQTNTSAAASVQTTTDTAHPAAERQATAPGTSAAADASHTPAGDPLHSPAAWQSPADINTPLQIDTVEFITAFNYSGAEPVFFRVFDDTPAKDPSKARNLQAPARALASVMPELHRCNLDKRGVFFVVNGGGNADAETKAKGKARAQFMEIDERQDENGKPLLDENGHKIKIPFPEQLEIIKSFPLEPSIIVKTSKSLHTYWLLDNGDIKQFKEIQKRLALYFHADNANINESRTMRLPGFNHCKAEPVPVEIIKFDPGIKYTQQELATLLPELPKRKPAELPPVDANEPTLYEKAGGRHNALIHYGGNLRRSGLNADEIKAQMQAYNYNGSLPEPLPERELNSIIADILKYKSRDELEELQKTAKAQDNAERLTDPRDIINTFLQTIQTEAYKPYSTDLAFFDNLLGGGVIRQSIVQLIAAPSAGKTTLCQQIAEAMARHGKQVLYLNLEMSAEQMLAKALSCRLSRKDSGDIVSATDILQGYKWDTMQRDRIIKELERYQADTAPFIRYENANNDLESIKGLLQAMGEKATKEGHPAPVVFVDYLHLITGTKYGDTQELIKAAVGCFKEYAIKYNSIVFLIVAANRESNKSGQYTLDSGRDSSAIEYSGDYVLSLNYTEIDNGNIKPTDEAELAKIKSGAWRDMTLRVLKHRLGVPGINARLWYRPAANIFYDSADFMPVDPERDRIADEAAQRALARKNPGRDQSDKQTKAGGLFAAQRA